jgi:dihydrofolate reductase
MVSSKMKLSRPVYLIVATTISPPLGIGLNGSLPWGPLREDMAFFKRVTTESHPQNTTSTMPPVVNAVIMGRKTWDSIPPRFRPLKGRLNVILKRTEPSQFANSIVDELRSKPAPKLTSPKFSASKSASNPLGIYSHCSSNSSHPVFISNPADPSSPVLVANSTKNALETCDIGHILAGTIETQISSPHHSAQVQVGNIFVIGGSEVYRSALAELVQHRPVRILQTQVRRLDGKPIECDTFFTEQLEGSNEWKQVEREAVEEWMGTNVPQGVEEWKVDGDMEIRVVGWERT